MEDCYAGYFRLRYCEEITGYTAISNYKKISEKEIRQTHSSLKHFFCTELNIDLKKYDEIFEYFSNFHRLWALYKNNARKEMMTTSYEAFMNWWVEQKNQCGYCGITQEELYEIVCNNGENLTLNDGVKRSKGTLEIDRKDCKEKDIYTLDNSMLCCPLCNNAKSNLIDEVSWRKFFVEPMRQYYEHIIGKRLLNKKPE